MLTCFEPACAGHMLAVTTRPDDQELRHNTALHSCMDCPVFDILPATCSCAGFPAASDPHRDQDNPSSQQVAVRHVWGISILDVTIPTQMTKEFPHARPVLSPALFIPAAMQVAAMAWNPLIEGELLYASGDGLLHSLQLAIGGSSLHQTTEKPFGPDAAARVAGCTQHSRCSTGALPQPRQVVTGLPGHKTISKHPVSLAVVAHPRRVYLAINSSVYVADVRLLSHIHIPSVLLCYTSVVSRHAAILGDTPVAFACVSTF